MKEFGEWFATSEAIRIDKLIMGDNKVESNHINIPFRTNKEPKCISIDLDGTLTDGTPFWEGEPKPNERMVQYTRDLVRNGHTVIVWTARSWDLARETAAWLLKHDVWYMGLFMQKKGGDLMIDDKAYNAQIGNADFILDEYCNPNEIDKGKLVNPEERKDDPLSLLCDWDGDPDNLCKRHSTIRIKIRHKEPYNICVYHFGRIHPIFIESATDLIK